MKKLLFFTLVFNTIFSFETTAQVWVEDDAVWHYDFYVSGSGFYKIELGEDTLIQNKNCQKYIIMKYTFFSQANGVYLEGPVIDYPSEFTHTSGDTVFRFKNGKFYTLFNFGADVGDQWAVDDKPVPDFDCDTLSRVRILEKGEIEMNGNTLRTLRLETIHGSPFGLDGWVIENIGPIGSQYLFPTGRSCNDSTIICFEQYSFKCFEDSRIGLYNPSGIDCEYLLNHVGIDELADQGFEVYPNPSNGVIHIQFHRPGTYKLIVTDQMGKTVCSNLLSGKNEKINLTNLPKGIYILRIEYRPGMFATKKLVKN